MEYMGPPNAPTKQLASDMQAEIKSEREIATHSLVLRLELKLFVLRLC